VAASAVAPAQLLSCSHDKTVKLWDLRAPRGATAGAAKGGPSRLVVESPWSKLTSQCQRSRHPPQLNQSTNLDAGAAATPAIDFRNKSEVRDL
jgi:hypothetical protein